MVMKLQFFCRFTLAFCAVDKIAFYEEWLSLSDLFVWYLRCSDLLLKIVCYVVIYVFFLLDT